MAVHLDKYDACTWNAYNRDVQSACLPAHETNKQQGESNGSDDYSNGTAVGE